MAKLSGQPPSSLRCHDRYGECTSIMGALGVCVCGLAEGVHYPSRHPLPTTAHSACRFCASATDVIRIKRDFEDYCLE